MLADCATTLLMAGDTGEASQVASEALRLSGQRRSDDSQLAEVVDAVARLLTDDPSGAQAVVDKIPFLSSVRDPERIGSVVVLGALPLIWIDEHRAALGLLEPIREMARAAALAGTTEAVNLAHELDVGSALSFCVATLAGVEALLGRADECRSHVAAALELVEAVGNESLRPFVRRSLGLLELGLGEYGRAVDTLVAIGSDAARLALADPGVVPWKPDAFEALLRTGRRSEAADLLASLEHEIELTGRRSGRAGAARCRGLLSEGDFDSLFAESIEIFDALGCALDRARTQLCYGERLRQANRRAEAKAQLRAALTTFEYAGADPWIGRVRHELRVVGDPLPEGVSTAFASLTSKELQIALAVGRGMTNREAAAAHFLSPRTVDTHLTRVYRKLGVRSRTELANVMARHEQHI